MAAILPNFEETITFFENLAKNKKFIENSCSSRFSSRYLPNQLKDSELSDLQ